jgi:hypothetical protein
MAVMAVRTFFKTLFRRPAPREEPVSVADGLDRAHLLLLTRFLSPTDPEQLRSRQWAPILGESVESAVRRFVTRGLIAKASTAKKLEHSLNAGELRTALKQAGLRHDGPKADLATRLADERPDEATARVAGIIVWSCTARGRALAAEAVSRDREERKIAEDAVLEALLSRDFKTAADAVVQFERNQVFPRGLNVTWDAAECDRLTAEVEEVYRVNPKILRGVSDDVLESLRPRAAMMLLWGESRLRQTPETGSRFSGDVAARMLIFAVLARRNLDQMRASGIARGIEILSAEDSCDQCKRLSNRQYPFRRVPELPYPGCTHAVGCRCCYVAVT